jgi:hypothetical protein
MLSPETLILPALVSLLANLTADRILATRYRISFTLDTTDRRVVRALRWLLTTLGLVAATLAGLSLWQLVVLGLLAVSAGTDLEHLRLPPSAYIYTATVIGVVAAFLQTGWDGAREAIVAQTVWFALMTLTVMLLRRTAGGDIKLMMQYGAACGNLPLSLIGMIIASGVMIPISLIYWLRFRRAIPRTPLAPLAWLGALVALLLENAHALPLI